MDNRRAPKTRGAGSGSVDSEDTRNIRPDLSEYMLSKRSSQKGGVPIDTGRN